ncbi:glycosyltransferase [Streptomyces sp. V4I2]|uniref:glycosyltransferase n=1 Tax=Streptomyces sp. V4I2 TaxID=3042280 RepID=UPI0027883C85|nr:glycosyltransferase [Streptomyces sp. V4I2]MDQ1048320.1 glycosyltransferase involved in cell wall biosynthesis [Streptomyces sp. V4I2]
MTTTRICEVIKTLNVGGAEVLLVERLRRAPRTDREYTVVFLQADTEELVEALREDGVTVVDLRSGRLWLRYARLIGVVRRLAPDVVNFHSPLVAAVLRPALRLMRRRPLLVSTVHQVRYHPLTMLLDRHTRRLDDQTVAVSSLVADAPTVRGARRVRTRVHGVDVAAQQSWARQTAQVRDEFGLPADAFLLVCVASLSPKKNHALLIEAAARVLAERPDALFVLAGDGPLREQVLADIDRRGLRERFRYLGLVPGAGRLVAAADILLLSSTHEGLPVVVMEALAAGVPVVSTAVGGIPELIHDNRNGILTPPGSPEVLAEGVLRAMRPEVHRVLAAGARADAAKVDVSETADWFDDLYLSMMAEARRG